MGTIAHRLRSERIAARLTQGALADRVGVSKQAISSLERGESKSLKGETLARLCATLKLNENWLLTGKGPKAAVQSQSVTLDPVILTDTYNTIVSILKEDGRFFDMSRHAEAFRLVYSEGGTLEPQDRARLRDLLIAGPGGGASGSTDVGETGDATVAQTGRSQGLR